MANSADAKHDPYEYLNRDGFTSEKFKIEIRGMPRFYGMGELKKFLNEKLELQTCKIKMPKPGSRWIYVCFRNEESRTRAISVLNGLDWKNSTLRAQRADPSPDPYRKVKPDLEKEYAGTSVHIGIDCDDGVDAAWLIRQNTTPLWGTPYECQLKKKQSAMITALKTICKRALRQWDGDQLTWLHSQQKKYNGLPCELLPIRSMDEIDGYRNKCEFTVGRSNKLGPLKVGFRLGTYVKGLVEVGPVDDLCHISDKMKAAVKIIELCLQTSTYAAYDPCTNEGNWKQVTVRTTRTGDLMLVFVFVRQSTNDQELENVKKHLKEFFETGSGANAGVTSLYFQTFEQLHANRNASENLWHISGKEYIEEILFGMKFRISPQAFFQVNTAAAELLYQSVINLTEPNSDTAVLDVCCGTGTIGIAFSEYCGEVYGMEVIPAAIKDAKENAAANNITNCEFFVGKAEDTLPAIIRRVTKPNIIAVVDPPRAGLHQKALLSLRRAKKISRVAYISCDIEAAANNIVDLGRSPSKRYVGDPLVPVLAVAVDMFPYTTHCELILILERLSDVLKRETAAS